MEDVEGAVLTNSRREPEGDPDSGAVVHDIDAGWHDANDLVKTALDIQGVSNDRLSSKDDLPQLVRENRERGRQAHGTIGLLLAEEASLRRLNAKRVEQVRVDRYRPHAQRSIACREVDFAGSVGPTHGSVRADRSKRSIYLPDFQVLLHR